MSIYLDTSVVVAVFSQDAFTSRAERFLGKNSEVILVSDLAALNFHPLSLGESGIKN